jgi:hypothetical protein
VSDAGQYAWVEDDEELSATCFTAVTGVGIDEVARRFGADPTAERTATFAQAFNAMTGRAPLLYDELDGDVLVAENNGWQGSRPEVLEAVSRGGRAASVYWSVNADMGFVYAVDGVVVAWFDPLLVELEWTGSDPESVRRQATDLPFGVDGPRSASLALVTRLIGPRLERSWLERPHRCADVQDADEVALPSVEDYRSFVRQALDAWWRGLRGKR